MLVIQIALGIVLGGVLLFLLAVYLDKVLIGVVVLIAVVIVVLLAVGNWWAFFAPASDMNHGSGEVMRIVVGTDFLIGWAIASSVYSRVSDRWQARKRNGDSPSDSPAPPSAD